MSESYIFADFPAGYITERIVDGLSQLSIPKIAELLEKGILVVPGTDDPDCVFQNLTHRNLRWYRIDDYAEACGMSLKEIIYGDAAPSKTYYSPFDDIVIPLLNKMPQELIQAATEVLYSVCYNPRFRISPEDSPSAKIIALAVTGQRMPQPVPEEELDRYETDINEELNRLCAGRSKERFVFHLDYILDMCTFCHVSPHWAFSLSGPLLCDSSEADALFDIFCLLSKPQQTAALSMFVELCSLLPNAVSDEMKTAVMDAIKREGGVVSCQ